MPGSAERIIAAFEEQGTHRRWLERYALTRGNYRSFAGLTCGFVVTILVMFLSFVLIRGGHGTEGTILATVDLVGLVGVFIYGTHVLRDERIQKTRIMSGQEGGNQGTNAGPDRLRSGAAE